MMLILPYRAGDEVNRDSHEAISTKRTLAPAMSSAYVCNSTVERAERRYDASKSRGEIDFDGVRDDLAIVAQTIVYPGFS